MQDGALLGGDRAANAAEWSIGVDFGTAFSKAAATRVASTEGAALREVRPLRIGDAAGWGRPFLTPSSMFLDRERVHFGPRATERLSAANIEERELVRSFKTVLGSHDHEGALDFYPRANVDPDRVFKLRDLIVLYLAYLLALVDAAAEDAFGEGGVIDASRLRFCRPGWLPNRIAAAHETMVSLFNEAHHVRAILGDAILAPNGVDYAAARGALDAARADPPEFENLDGGIYEASAVGICHYGDPKAPDSLLIVDIGAGTTDIAGLMRTPVGEEIRVIRTARRTIDVAGDHFDAALLDLLLSKARWVKKRSDRSALWRTVVPVVRDLKEELFKKGAIQVPFRDHKIRCTAVELERHPPFKAAVDEINTLYEKCLAEAIEAGRTEGVRRIGVLLAGGGSHLPAIRRAVMRWRWVNSKMRIEHLPQTPNWARELSSSQELGALFAQLSAAFGAAISRPQRASAPNDYGRTISV